VAGPFFESVGPVLEQAPEAVPAVARQETTGLDGSEAVTELAAASTTTPRPVCDTARCPEILSRLTAWRTLSLNV